MAPLRSLILLAICFAAAGDKPRPDWERLYARSLDELNFSKFDAARSDAEAGYRTWLASPDSVWHWRFRLALADALVELGRTDEARALLTQAAPTPELEAHRLVGLAYVKGRAHDFQGARACLKAAKALTPQGPGELRGRMEPISGMMDLKEERQAEAESSFRRALDAVAGSHSLVESYSLIDLGFLDLREFRYDEAVTWFERARRLAEQTGANRAAILAAGNLGDAYLRLGDYERALTFLNQAVTLAANTHERVYQMLYLYPMGELSHYLQDDTKAAEYYEKALSLAHPQGDEDWLVAIQNDLAELALLRGDIPTARRLNGEATRVAEGVRNLRGLIGSHIRAAEILRALGQGPDAEMRYRDAVALSRQVEDPISLWESYAGLASLYTSEGRTGAAAEHYRLAISTIETQCSRLKREQSKFTFLSHLIRFYREYVDFLVERGDVAEAFRVAESCRARVLAEKLHGNGDVQRAADLNALRQEASRSRTVFLSYWLAPKRSFLWAIDTNGLHLFPLPKEEEISANVRHYMGAVLRGRDPLGVDNPSGRWLFANLIPARYPIPAGSSVVIVPDGSLHQLNFESLPADDGSRYWISDVAVSIAPSLALLGRPPAPGPERLLLMGDPNLEGTEFSRLPNVESELDAVSRRFPAREVYTGLAATPAVYRQAGLERYSTLHFATHAVANRNNPLDSAIILSGGADGRKLYARDVLAHRLRAELVTLSACQTAGNRSYYGEGLTGLAWAFLSAGARNVVAGLWEVDDRATAELMEHFYAKLGPGTPPAQALREAKLCLIASGGTYRKPLYWAAFETFSRTVYPPPAGHPSPGN